MSNRMAQIRAAETNLAHQKSELVKLLLSLGAEKENQ
jgi:hypothetical protein